MFVRRLTTSFKEQHWMTIVIELLIVIIGVFVGTQVSNWNEQRLQRAATARMLTQLAPEIRSQIEFFDSIQAYYATTRTYADRAFAGWRRDPRISDEQFVIAAYQASQINGIAINPDSWSLTFGGDQLRDIDDPGIRRNLELALTADYSPVELPAVATPYREEVRQIIPSAIQDSIRAACGDRNARSKEGAFIVSLPATCALNMDKTAAASAAAALRAHPDLVGQLRWHLAAVATFMGNAQNLAVPIRDLERQLDKRP